MNIRDIKGLKNKSKLEISGTNNEYGDYYTVKLKLKDGVSWRPGEHGIFTLPESDVRGKKWRAFSVASVPEEGYVLIGTRTGASISSFKKNLINMQTGDSVAIRGPFGWFTKKDDTSPMVFIAGGVGITPVRAILKQTEYDTSRPVEIIHSAEDYHLFGDEIKIIAGANGMITYHQTRAKEETQSKIVEIAGKYKNLAYYYISGSFDIIKSVRRLLKKEGIKGKRFVHDPFLGY